MECTCSGSQGGRKGEREEGEEGERESGGGGEVEGVASNTHKFMT